MIKSHYEIKMFRMDVYLFSESIGKVYYNRSSLPELHWSENTTVSNSPSGTNYATCPYMLKLLELTMSIPKTLNIINV